jgi:hypothetical protein
MIHFCSRVASVAMLRDHSLTSVSKNKTLALVSVREAQDCAPDLRLGSLMCVVILDDESLRFAPKVLSQCSGADGVWKQSQCRRLVPFPRIRGDTARSL